MQTCAVIYGGAGKHMYDVTYEEHRRFKTFVNIDKLIFFLTVGFVKVSICFFNQRLTSLTSRAWSIFNNVFLFLLFVYISMALFWNTFQCNPPYAGWDAIRATKRRKLFYCTSDTIVGSTLMFYTLSWTSACSPFVSSFCGNSEWAGSPDFGCILCLALHP
jgi:hypothetical protein